MNDGEINAKKYDIIKQLQTSLAEYYDKLGTLHEKFPNFDLDIATVLHPDLADFNSPAGHARLAFWENLAAGLAAEPKYTLIRRYSTRQNSWRSPGTGHGGHLRRDDGMHRSVEHAWVEVYENLKPEAIRFGRDQESGVVCVYIDDDATVTHTEGAHEPTFLFSSDAPDAWVRDKQAITPHSHEPEIFFYADDRDLAVNRDYTHLSADEGLYFPIEISPELRAAVLENVSATSAERSTQDL